MIARPAAEQVTTQLVRLVAARRAYLAEVAAMGSTKAYEGPRFKRFARREESLIRSVRAPVPLPETPTAWGPMPTSENRALWIGGTLWALIEADEVMGYDAGIYPIASSAIRRLDDLATS